MGPHRNAFNINEYKKVNKSARKHKILDELLDGVCYWRDIHRSVAAAATHALHDVVVVLFSAIYIIQQQQ